MAWEVRVEVQNPPVGYIYVEDQFKTFGPF